MNLKELKEIIAMFEEANISELDVERQGVKIRLKKGVTGEIGQQHVVVPSQVSPPERVKEGEVKEGNLVEVKSPMVGTFYRAPAPDAKPYIKEGNFVRKGQVLCIIEAMKLMNEIEAERDGRVLKIVPQNVQPVEYNQTLFIMSEE